MKSKFTAGILCLLLGGLGLHEFYLGDTKKGICYIIAFIICAITGFGAIAYLIFQIGVAIYYFTMDQAKFDEKYNGIKPGSNAAYNANPSTGGAFKPIVTSPVVEADVVKKKDETTPKEKTKLEKLTELKQLLDEHLISQEEFEIKKREILNS